MVLVVKTSGNINLINFIFVPNLFLSLLRLFIHASEPTIETFNLMHSSIKKPSPEPTPKIFGLLFNLRIIARIFLKFFFLRLSIP